METTYLYASQLNVIVSIQLPFTLHELFNQTTNDLTGKGHTINNDNKQQIQTGPAIDKSGFTLSLKYPNDGAGKTQQWSTALPIHAQNPSLVPSTPH